MNPLLDPHLAAWLAPALLMTAAALFATIASPASPLRAWRAFLAGSVLASALAAGSLAGALWTPGAAGAAAPALGLGVSLAGAWIALLVQVMGTVIGGFSARYLEGEPGQTRYVASLAGVLAAVQVLLLADHWLVLIAAWAAAGLALQRLLCFYADRPFALLAARKKRIADRAADVLLIAAAALAWHQVGSGSLSDLEARLAAGGASIALQASAVCLVLAVMLRTALLPVHGWLIQVMEAPTPVSALLHAGVVNLGGFVLIRFASLLEAAPLARWLLVTFGLATAALAGLVMLTRVSIKVKLAWSTVAQMGFMLLECGLGLYTLALLHLIGHSLYKAHSFLASSSVVRETRLRALDAPSTASPASLLLAPLAAAALVWATGAAVAGLADTPWPWWWSAVLALAWAPLLWLPRAADAPWRTRAGQAGAAIALVLLLSALAHLGHALPLGVTDAADAPAGMVAAAGLAALYGCLALLQWRPRALAAWRRWSYAGFYVDEFYTRLALRLWPGGWTPSAGQPAPRRPMASSPLATSE